MLVIWEYCKASLEPTATVLMAGFWLAVGWLVGFLVDFWLAAAFCSRDLAPYKELNTPKWPDHFM